jgi:hypothetical protein
MISDRLLRTLISQWPSKWNEGERGLKCAKYKEICVIIQDDMCEVDSRHRAIIQASG